MRLKNIIIVILINLIGLLASADQNPYEVLGVNKTDSIATIKQAHRALAKKFHPDLNPDNPSATEKFLEVQQAYEILSSPEKRAQFDKYGTTTSNAYDNFRQAQANRYKESVLRNADAFGPKYSNDKWVYEAASRRFYDRRTNKWLKLKELEVSWVSDEGWSFDPTTGKYFSLIMAAYWNPDDGRGWARYIGLGRNGSLSGGREWIFLNPKNGFSLATRYSPKTTSESSELFDKVLNPLSIYNDLGKSDRANLLQQLDNLDWNHEQKEDYTERLREHIRIFKYPDTEPRSASDVQYYDMFLSAILDNNATKKFPELVNDIIHSVRAGSYKHLSQILVREDWLSNKNSSQWLKEVLSNEKLSSEFIRILIQTDKGSGLNLTRFEKILLLLKQTGIAPTVMDQIVHSFMYHYGEKDFPTYSKLLTGIVETPEFSQLIAGYDASDRQTEAIKAFLEAYKALSPKTAEIYKNALEMPGTNRSNFYRLSQDRTINNFHADEYEQHKKQTTAQKISYLQKSLPEVFRINSTNINSAKDFSSHKQAITKFIEWELTANPALDKAALIRMASVIIINGASLPFDLSKKMRDLQSQVLDDSKLTQSFKDLDLHTKNQILEKLTVDELNRIVTLPAQIEFLEFPEIAFKKAVNLTNYELQSPDLQLAKSFTRFEKDGISYIRWFIHPLAQKHGEELKKSLTEVLGIDLRLSKGSYYFHFTSSRSLIVFSDKNNYSDAVSLKLSLPMSEGPFKNKKIHLKEWSAWARHNIYIADNVRGGKLPHLSLQQEPYGFGFNSQNLEDAFLFRSINQFGEGKYLLPAFSVFDEKVGKKIALLNGSTDPVSFWEEYLIKPLAQGSAELRASTGAAHTSPHSQNLLVELDQNMRPTGKIVMRDFDFYMDAGTFSNLNRSSLQSDGMTRMPFERVSFLLRNGMEKLPTWMSEHQFQDWVIRYFKYYKEEFSRFTGIPEHLIFSDTNLYKNWNDKVSTRSDFVATGTTHMYLMRLSEQNDFQSRYNFWLKNRSEQRGAIVQFNYSNSTAIPATPKQMEPEAKSDPTKPLIEIETINSWDEFVKSFSTVVSVDQYEGKITRILRGSENLNYKERQDLNSKLTFSGLGSRLPNLFSSAKKPTAILEFSKLLFNIDPSWLSFNNFELVSQVQMNWWTSEQRNVLNALNANVQKVKKIVSDIRTGSYHAAMSAIVETREIKTVYTVLSDAYAYRINREADPTLKRYLAYELARLGKDDETIKSFLVGKKDSFSKEEMLEINKILGISEALEKPKSNLEQFGTRSFRIRCESVFRNAG